MVRHLPPLGEETVTLWWPLARQEINRAYPDIERVIYGPKPSLYQGKQLALRAIREAFLLIWKMFS